VDRVNAANGFGVFVTGQSMLDEPKGSIAKKLTDAALANFTDYEPVMDELQRLKNDFLLLTGDVHFGRVTRLVTPDLRRQGFEVIVSPSALVTTIGADSFKKTKNLFKSIFGASDPWPRHGDGEAASDKVDRFLLTESIPLHGKERRQQVGDHVGVLSFRVQKSQGRTRLLVQIRYLPAHPKAAVRAAGSAVFSHQQGFVLETRP